MPSSTHVAPPLQHVSRGSGGTGAAKSLEGTPFETKVFTFVLAWWPEPKALMQQSKPVQGDSVLEL